MKRGRPFSSSCPSWLEIMCEKWGRTVHNLIFGQSGWPARTMLGRIIEEGCNGAAAQGFVQHHPEVMTGEALAVSCAIKRIPDENLRTILFTHYVIRKPVKAKADKLGIERSTYYSRLDRAHSRLSLELVGQKTPLSVQDYSDALV